MKIFRYCEKAGVGGGGGRGRGERCLIRSDRNLVKKSLC